MSDNFCRRGAGWRTINIPIGSNLKLIQSYLTYLRVEKGLRPLTCEAYRRDLLQCAEFLETDERLACRRKT